MKQKGAEGLAAVNRMSPAAKEEFTGTANGLERLARPQSGWDPYEVWRTRVKGDFTVTQERNAGARTRPVTPAGEARDESMTGWAPHEA
jgi:hypothetical protein